MELDSHRRGLDAIHARAVAELVRLAAKTEPIDGSEPTSPTVRQVRVRNFASKGLRTSEDVETALEALREACLEALSKGEIVVFE